MAGDREIDRGRKRRLLLARPDRDGDHVLAQVLAVADPGVAIGGGDVQWKLTGFVGDMPFPLGGPRAG